MAKPNVPSSSIASAVEHNPDIVAPLASTMEHNPDTATAKATTKKRNASAQAPVASSIEQNHDVAAPVASTIDGNTDVVAPKVATKVAPKAAPRTRKASARAPIASSIEQNLDVAAPLASTIDGNTDVVAPKVAPKAAPRTRKASTRTRGLQTNEDQPKEEPTKHSPEVTDPKASPRKRKASARAQEALQSHEDQPEEEPVEPQAKRARLLNTGDLENNVAGYQPSTSFAATSAHNPQVTAPKAADLKAAAPKTNPRKRKLASSTREGPDDVPEGESSEPQAKRLQVHNAGDIDNNIVGYHTTTPGLTISGHITSTGQVEFKPTFSKELQSGDIQRKWKSLVATNGKVQPGKVTLNEDVLQGVVIESEGLDGNAVLRGVWQKRKLVFTYLLAKGAQPANAHIEEPNVEHDEDGLSVDSPMDEVDLATAIQEVEEAAKAIRRVARSSRYAQEESPSMTESLKETIKGLKAQIRENNKTIAHQANKIRQHEHNESTSDVAAGRQEIVHMQEVTKLKNVASRLQDKITAYEKIPPPDHAQRQILEKRNKELAQSDERVDALQRKPSMYEIMPLGANGLQTVVDNQLEELHQRLKMIEELQAKTEEQKRALKKANETNKSLQAKLDARSSQPNQAPQPAQLIFAEFAPALQPQARAKPAPPPPSSRVTRARAASQAP